MELTFQWGRKAIYKDVPEVRDHAMRISKEKNSTIGNSDDKGLEVGACLSSRNGKKEASVAVPGERESQQLGGHFVGHCKSFGFSSELGSMCFDRITTAMVLRRDFGRARHNRKLVRMKLQQPLRASSGGGEVGRFQKCFEGRTDEFG